MTTAASMAARLVAVATGVWLMFAPWVLGYHDPAATNDRIIGPIAAAFAFVACWGVLSAMRWATLPCGAWLVTAPLTLGYDDATAWASSIVSGLVIVTTALVGTDLSDRFGGGWRSVRPSAWTSP